MKKAIITLLVLSFVVAPLTAQAKKPKLDRDRVAQLINETEVKLYQYHEADPMKLLKYKWIDFGNDKGKLKNVWEAWYKTDKGSNLYVYYTFNKKQKPKLIFVGGTIPIEKQQDWKFKQR